LSFFSAKLKTFVATVVPEFRDSIYFAYKPANRKSIDCPNGFTLYQAHNYAIVPAEFSADNSTSFISNEQSFGTTLILSQKFSNGHSNRSTISPTD
jgi:hypothetical protein